MAIWHGRQRSETVQIHIHGPIDWLTIRWELALPDQGSTNADRMRRREFLIVIGGAAVAWPLAVRAQQAGKTPTIGFLGANSAAGQSEWMAAFVGRLGELGWVEGRTVAIEYRWAEGHFDRAPALIGELMRLKIDIIVTHGTPDVLAAKQATSEIPIVFAVAGDPVGNHLVTSLARPGGNVTGLSIQSPELVGKRVELLREMVPGLAGLGLLMNTANISTPLEQQELEGACRTLGVRLETMLVRQPGEIVAAIEALAARAQFLYVPLDPLFNSNLDRLNAAAIAARMPTMYSTSDGVQAGGLLAYGPSITANFRRAAELSDKILRGAKPADIPVEQSAKFDLAVNLKTARAIGLFNRDCRPVPFTKPATPALPATVLTRPAGVILRMAWLLRSATKMVPSAAMATPRGFLKRAIDPRPSALPLTPARPARVDTSLAGVINRIN